MIKSTLLLLLMLMALSVSAQTLLEWDRNPAGEAVAGYRVYHGFASRHYTDVRDAGDWTSVEVQPIPCAVSHWFAVTAYTVDGLESEYSEEAEWVPTCPKPSQPGGLRIKTGPETNTVALEWSADLLRWDALGTFVMTNEKGFFRVVQPQVLSTKGTK